MYKVAIEKTNEFYYPKDISVYSSETDHVFRMVEKCFKDLELDSENYETDKWNPLSVYINPGDKVVVKPNLVLHKNYCKKNPDNTDCVYTQPSVINAVLYYVVKALDGKGKIVLGDAPVQECDFDKLIKESGLDLIVEKYKNQGIDIELKDFRGLRSVSSYGVLHQTENKDARYNIVKLQEKSAFFETRHKNINKVRITNYTSDELAQHHNENIHEYCVAADILEADVIINMPKPKTHKKAGLTACLKNLVGINCRKEYLPHHTVGAVSEGGDEYNGKSLLKRLRSKNHDKFCMYCDKKEYFRARFFQALVILQDFWIGHFYKDRTSFGSWSGNNTISKTTVDLNKILLYADKNGNIKDVQQRKVLNICDMIISGEHNGPMAPEPKNCGFILVGENSFILDNVIAEIMGANKSKIPTFSDVLNCNKNLPLFSASEKVEILSSNFDISKGLNQHFKAPDDWDNVYND